MASHPLTVRLNDEDYALLEEGARRQGVRPATLARAMLQAHLREPETAARRGGMPAREVLARLAELRKDLPPVDAVEIVRAGRADLEERSWRALR